MSQVTQNHYLEWRNRTPQINAAIEAKHQLHIIIDSGNTQSSFFDWVSPDKIISIVKKALENSSSQRDPFHLLILGDFTYAHLKNLTLALADVREFSSYSIILNSLNPNRSHNIYDSYFRFQTYQHNNIKAAVYYSSYLESPNECLNEAIGKDLTKKVDLIVVDYFSQMIDPLSTFAALYELLKPEIGIMLMDCPRIHLIDAPGNTLEGNVIEFFQRSAIPFVQLSDSKFLACRKDELPCNAPYVFGPFVDEEESIHISYSHIEHEAREMCEEDYSLVRTVARGINENDSS